MFPQQVRQLVGPSLFYVLGHGHQRVCVARFAFSEPYFEFRVAVSDFGSEPNVTGFYAVLVHVQVQVLRRKKTTLFEHRSIRWSRTRLCQVKHLAYDESGGLLLGLLDVLICQLKRLFFGWRERSVSPVS